MQFTSMQYTLKYQIELNGDTISEGILVYDTKYMSHAQENSRWWLEPEVILVYNTVYLRTVLVPKFNVEVFPDTL